MIEKRRESLRYSLVGLCVCVVGCLVLSLAGCSLVVMTGRMFFGNPKITSQFRQRTHVDLRKSKKEVLIVCTTPNMVKSEYSAIDFKIVETVSRKLKREGIRVVDANKVLSWIDDNGGRWDHADEIAKKFDTDYIVHIDLKEFRFRDRNSPNLFQGRAMGLIHVYEVVGHGSGKRAQNVFESHFESEYPRQPVTRDSMSQSIFLHRYIDRVSDRIAKLFYDYRMLDTM